ncbi:VOC family protein [Nocardioides donggukensis]|uniref:Glyoxalase n=1 Tax=Nocardioides donggukensis TaxID=2774019 RepID=A0A927K5K8_9ACTN|nr:VOC family protein [Nocardioides donggukensis]MBD8870664.1 glyoxalase [Nocardioides donggukensis]
MRLHHVQLSCPPGGEDAARRFWRDGLGLTEVPKPTDLAGRGGCWFRGYADSGGEAATVEVHVGVEEDFRPARRAHPALLLDDVAALESVVDRLGDLGFEADWAERHTFPGFERAHVRDAHGNRVELLAP